MEIDRISYIKGCACKVLPLVVDQSITDYEQLCNVVGKMNELIKSQNDFLDQFSADLDTTVTAILTEWLNNGVFDDLINNKLFSQLNPITSEITVYVSKNGSSSGDGSISSPFDSLPTAIAWLNGISRIRELFATVNIRILAGDYSAYPATTLSNYSKQNVRIVAWDGTAEVNAFSDNYIINGLNLDSCDQVEMVGIQIKKTPASAYGMFITNVRHFRLWYYKDVTAGYNGLGITANSNVVVTGLWLENKTVGVSCNWNSKTQVSNIYRQEGAEYDFKVNNGLWAHTGSEIRVGTPIPDNWAYYDTVTAEGGMVYNYNGKADPQNPDSSWTGEYTITNSANSIYIGWTKANTPFKDFMVMMTGPNNQWALGWWTKDGIQSITHRSDGTFLPSNGAFCTFADGAGKYDVYTTGSVADNAFTLVRNTSYTPVGQDYKVRAMCRC